MCVGGGFSTLTPKRNVEDVQPLRESVRWQYTGYIRGTVTTRVVCQLWQLGSYANCHYSGRMPTVTTLVVCQLSLLGSYANCHYSGRMPIVTTRVVCQLSLPGSYANCHYSGRMPAVTTRVVCQLSLLGSYATLLKKDPSGCYAPPPPPPPNPRPFRWHSFRFCTTPSSTGHRHRRHNSKQA